MKAIWIGLAGVLVAAGFLTGMAADEGVPPPETEARGAIEVCFVLDTTGSMSGLIEGAKRKIWSIANDMASAKPVPRIKMGLVAYRDRGDEYVTQVHNLTDDIDAIHTSLMGFSAAGGGDTPESVNQALHEAVTMMSWSDDPDTYKVIFLVGDAPPHMDYKDDVKYPVSCEMAVRKNIIINTIQCGNMAATVKPWQEMAALGEGSYVAIGQSGDMIVVASPMDRDIAALRAKMGAMRIGYAGGRGVAQSKALEADMAAPAMAPSGAARAEYMDKTEAARRRDWSSGDAESLRELGAAALAGDADLLEAIAYGAVKLDELDEAKLPDELKKMNPEERVRFVEGRQAERQAIEEQLQALIKEREAFLAEERKKLPEKRDGFDEQVGKIIREQASQKGIVYAE